MLEDLYEDEGVLQKVRRAQVMRRREEEEEMNDDTVDVDVDADDGFVRVVDDVDEGGGEVKASGARRRANVEGFGGFDVETDGGMRVERNGGEEEITWAG